MPRPIRRKTSTLRTEDDGRHAEAAKTTSARLIRLVNTAQAPPRDPHEFLLLARFGVINLVAFALLGAGHVHGFTDLVLAADPTRLVVVIFLVFLAGLGLCGWRIAQTSRELNQVKAFDPPSSSRVARYLSQVSEREGHGRLIAASVLKLKLASRISAIRHIANSLVFLGLIGTVIGFIMALSGVDPANASDAASVAPMVAKLLEGISVALYTTLVGAVLSLWLTANYHILSGGTINLIEALTERGEADGRA